MINQFGNANQQQGATLLVALILLVLLGVLGTSALKNSSVEEKMAAHQYQKSVTLQESESSYAQTNNNQALHTQAIMAGEGVEVVQAVTTNTNNVTSQVTYSYTGWEHREGYGTESGIVNQRYLVSSISQIGSTGARTTTVHGLLTMGSRPE